MQPSHKTVSPIEKIISLASYFTMGIAGLIWIIVAYFMNKRLKFFLMYNIAQSMLISIFLAIFNLGLRIIIQILMIIPFLSTLAIKLNIFFSRRVLVLFGLSFSIVETIVFLLLIYISIGILSGRISKIPFLTNIMKMVMRSYN